MTTKRLPTLKELAKDAAKVTGTKPGDEDFKCCLILLASAFVGPSENRVAKYTQLDRKYVDYIGNILRKNKIWTKTKVSGNEWFGENGGIALCLDVAVARGLMARVNT